MFFLTVKKVTNSCTTKSPDDSKTNPTKEQLEATANWEEKDFLCRNFILNGLTNDLYDYYNTLKTTKEVWYSLQKKYDTEEGDSKKYALAVT